jgi:hypothetical protein
MDVVRVQRWIASALVMTVAFLFAGGVAIASATSEQPGARPGLLTMSTVVGLVALIGVRLINAKPVLTPWLVLGALPAVFGWFVTR